MMPNRQMKLAARRVLGHTDWFIMVCHSSRNWQPEECCVSAAHADLFIMVCHSGLGNVLM